MIDTQQYLKLPAYLKNVTHNFLTVTAQFTGPAQFGNVAQRFLTVPAYFSNVA
jgi:hypothetical protein